MYHTYYFPIKKTGIFSQKRYPMLSLGHLEMVHGALSSKEV